jgi:thioredoxin 1
MSILFNDSNFEEQVLGSKKLVLVDFFTPSCGPCKKMAPTIDKLADELKDIAVIGKTDVSENMNLAAKYQISAVPTLILFKDGVEIKRTMGLMSEVDLKKMIEANK